MACLGVYTDELNSLLELLDYILFEELEFFLYPEVRALVPIDFEDDFNELELFLVGVPDPVCLVFELPLCYCNVQFELLSF